MTEFDVLGPVRVRQGSETTELAGRMQGTLLGVLLLHANRPVSADALIDTLWGGEPVARAENRLQVHVHRLRGLLDEPDRLTHGPGGYRLRAAAGEMDAERFEALLDEASDAGPQEPGRAATLLREALGLWRGTAYQGLDTIGLAEEANRLADRRQEATESLYEAELARGRHAAIVADLTELVRRDALRERPYALLMTALYRSGRQAEALQVYQDARRALVDEVGLEPGPELRAIEEQVLAGEPVTLGTPPAAPAVPRQLPANVRAFTGRDAELAGLDRLLEVDDGGSVVISAVAGTAGVGKTALAVRWAHRVRDRFPDGQLYVDLRGYGPDEPVPPADALAGFLRALDPDRDSSPLDTPELAARFRSLVDGRKILVVLDNARTVEQVRPLLPGTASAFVLVTSRDSLSGLAARDGAHRVDLDRLPTEEAIDLLRELLGVPARGLGSLVEQCARLPLALRIAAELVRFRARGDTDAAVRQVVDELTDERTRLDLLDTDEDPRSAVRVVFSWSYAQLPGDAARLFRTFGLHPGHDIDAGALAALAGTDVRTARRSLELLVRAHLVDAHDGRFHQHDLLRVYARELAEQVDRSEAIDRLFDHYLYAASLAMDLIAPNEADRRPTVAASPTAPELSSAEDAHDWLDRELLNLVGLSDLAETERLDERATALSGVLWRYLTEKRLLRTAITMHTRALEAAERLGDRRAEADSYRYLGSCSVYLNDYDRAASYTERALELYTAIGDRSLRASALNNLGFVEYMRCRYTRAAEYIERSAELFRAVGDERHHALMLFNLGQVRVKLGQYESARELLEQDLDRTDRVGVPAIGRAMTLCSLANLARRTGDLDHAETRSREALELSRTAGALGVEQEASLQLGSALCLRGDLILATETLRDSLAIARGFDNQVGVAAALNRLGWTYRADGDPVRAMRAHGQALDAIEGIQSPHEQAHAHAGLGDAYAAIGDHRRAHEHWELALRQFDDLGVPEAVELRDRIEAAAPTPV